MKTSIFLIALFTLVSIVGLSQSLIGNWKLVKQTNCAGEEITPGSVDGQKNAGKDTPILFFKDAQNGGENRRILNGSKSLNAKTFLYKVTDNTLYILDKRSHIMVGSFTIDLLQSDSLTLSTVSQPCDMKFFSRIK